VGQKEIFSHPTTVFNKWICLCQLLSPSHWDVLSSISVWKYKLIKLQHGQALADWELSMAVEMTDWSGEIIHERKHSAGGIAFLPLFPLPSFYILAHHSGATEVKSYCLPFFIFCLSFLILVQDSASHTSLNFIFIISKFVNIVENFFQWRADRLMGLFASGLKVNADLRPPF
jgi:hypothetical protein